MHWTIFPYPIKNNILSKSWRRNIFLWGASQKKPQVLVPKTRILELFLNNTCFLALLFLAFLEKKRYFNPKTADSETPKRVAQFFATNTCFRNKQKLYRWYLWNSHRVALFFATKTCFGNKNISKLMLIPWTISIYLRMSIKDNIAINIFKNSHIDIDIDIVNPYIEHPLLRDARVTFVWDLLPWWRCPDLQRYCFNHYTRVEENKQDIHRHKLIFQPFNAD